MPEGALKRQVAGDISDVAKLPLAELSSLWQPAAAVAKPAESQPASQRPRARRAPRQGAATQLDRALWLLLHQSELWLELDSGSHDLLADQAQPHATLFAAFERCVHELGSLSSDAMIRELAKDLEPAGPAQGTLERIAQFHEPESGSDLRQQLHLLLDHLRLQEVDHELQLLFESGLMSPDIQKRSAELMQQRARLKGALSQPTTLSN